MQGDLISRSALLEALKKQHDYIMQDPEVSKTMAWCEAVCFRRTVEALDFAPAVDAVEVVRCRDCEHYEFGFCMRTIMYSKAPNGFCESGERRADK